MAAQHEPPSQEYSWQYLAQLRWGYLEYGRRVAHTCSTQSVRQHNITLPSWKMREIGDRVEQRVDIRFVQTLGEVFVL